MTLSNQKIEYSNCRTLPIESYGYPGMHMWKHRGPAEFLFGSYINATQMHNPRIRLKVTFKDGTFVYVTKK